MAHTPGPWFLSPHDRYVRYEGVHGPNICDTEVFGGPVAEGVANAKLIAAAPDAAALLAEVEGYCPVAVQDKIRAWQKKAGIER